MSILLFTVVEWGRLHILYIKRHGLLYTQYWYRSIRFCCCQEWSKQQKENTTSGFSHRCHVFTLKSSSFNSHITHCYNNSRMRKWALMRARRSPCPVFLAVLFPHAFYPCAPGGGILDHYIPVARFFHIHGSAVPVP